MSEDREAASFGLGEFLEEEAASQLVSPGADPLAIKLALSRSGLKFSGESFCMGVMLEKLYEELYFLSRQNDPETSELRRKMDFSKELIKTVYGEAGRVLFMRRPGSLAFVLDLDPGSGCDAETLRALTKRITDELASRAGLSVRAGLSGIHHGLEELSSCFSETESLVRYCTIIGLEEPVALYGDYSFSPFPGRMIMAKGMEMRLFSCVRSGDYAEAAQLIADMTRDSFYPAPVSIFVAECKFSYLKSLMISLLSDVSMTVSVDFLEDINALRRILDAPSAQDFIDETGRVFAELTEFCATALKRLPPLWLRDVGKYIDDNYADPVLNISTIAERFGMSADYISKEFKAYRGISILEYIHTLRLAYARRCLAGGMNVHDVARRVGYGHERTMTRAFKKYEGITPGMLRGEESSAG